MKKIQIFLMTNLLCLLFTMTVFAGTWKHDQQGWWYQKETENYPSNTWLEIDNKWYYFNEKGYMQTGWIQSDEKWYYCGLNGGLVTDQWISETYYVGSDGAMYVNTTTPDGHKVNQLGIVITEEPKQTEINYANTLEGTFISTEEYESYKWWIKNRDTIMNDERIKYQGNNDYDRMEIAITYYPELSELYWTETSISNNEFSITAEQGFIGKSLIGGSIIWKGNNTATLVYDRNSGSVDLKVLDNNTIQIDGDKLIKIR